MYKFKNWWEENVDGSTRRTEGTSSVDSCFLNVLHDMTFLFLDSVEPDIDYEVA